MLTDPWYLHQSRSTLGSFDWRRAKRYAPRVPTKRLRRTLMLNPELVAAAEASGRSVTDFVDDLFTTRAGSHLATVASLYRTFALLEMARLPVIPNYADVVRGVLGEEAHREFAFIAQSGIPHALPHAAARLIGRDDRARAVEAIMVATQLARVLHEGFLESARMLESSFLR